MRKKPQNTKKSTSTSRPRRHLSIAEAVRRASRQVPPQDGDDQYFRNAGVAARALQLLLPNEKIDEDDVEFGVSFQWPDVPSPTALVRSYLEQQAPLQEPAIPAASATRAKLVQPFVYGLVNRDLYVLPKSVAEDWARLNRALNTCSTWGELRKAAPRDLYREARETLRWHRVPATRVIGHEELAEEGFPPPVGQIMQRHLPSDLDHLVQSENNALGQELPSLPEEALPQVLAVFSALGVPCRQADALVAAAAGYHSSWPEELR